MSTDYERARAFDVLNQVLSCALKGGATPDQCDSLLCWVLDLQQARRRTYTLERAQRLARIEQTLSHLDAGDRAQVVCDRMSLSRPTYYRLRKVAASLTEVETENG